MFWSYDHFQGDVFQNLLYWQRIRCFIVYLIAACFGHTTIFRWRFPEFTLLTTDPLFYYVFNRCMFLSYDHLQEDNFQNLLYCQRIRCFIMYLIATCFGHTTIFSADIFQNLLYWQRIRRFIMYLIATCFGHTTIFRKTFTEFTLLTTDLFYYVFNRYMFRSYDDVQPDIFQYLLYWQRIRCFF
jgi:hypothetical protein